MSIATKAAACTSCGKRLNRKSWFYRNNKYFCKRRCWETEQAKVAKEAATKAEAAAEAKSKADAEAKGKAAGEAEAKAA